MHLLEETSTLKITLTHDDGVWCEEIIVPEMRLLEHEGEDSDHLVLALDQAPAGGVGADLTVYFSCVPKGRLHLPYSLREMAERVRHSKVKLYHGVDLELQVFGKGNVERILHDLDCPVERMQAQEAAYPAGAGGGGGGDMFTYRRSVITGRYVVFQMFIIVFRIQRRHPYFPRRERPHPDRRSAGVDHRAQEAQGGDGEPPKGDA